MIPRLLLLALLMLLAGVEWAGEWAGETAMEDRGVITTVVEKHENIIITGNRFSVDNTPFAHTLLVEASDKVIVIGNRFVDPIPWGKLTLQQKISLLWFRLWQ